MELIQSITTQEQENIRGGLSLVSVSLVDLGLRDWKAELELLEADRELKILSGELENAVNAAKEIDGTIKTVDKLSENFGELVSESLNALSKNLFK